MKAFKNLLHIFVKSRTFEPRCIDYSCFSSVLSSVAYEKNAERLGVLRPIRKAGSLEN